MPLIETRKLTLHAGSKLLCEQLNWQCHAGEVWAVLGQNGTGKTRLLHALAGLPQHKQIRCTGEILLNGEKLAGLPRKQIAKQLGLLLQEYHEPFPGTVLDYVLMGRHPHLHAWQWETAQDYAMVSTALQRVGLSDFHQRDIQTLSGGEFQRMRIAMLLVQDPQILLLDEPINHLDLQFQHNILSTLTNAMSDSGKAIVMSIHDVNLASRYCSHAMLLQTSGQAICGPRDQVLTDQNLSTLYKYPIKQMTHNDRTVFYPE